MEPCPICTSDRTFLFRAIVRRKYKADYFLCPQCGLIQPGNPVWIEEAYSRALADIDTGVMVRNYHCIRVISTLIYTMFDKNARFLDVGGGHGLFVRSMRDVGFDYYWYDKYGDNLFARGFEGDLNDSYHFISALEVVEHVYQPIPFFERLLKSSPNVFLSTQLYPDKPPKPDEWNYYAFNSGQHVSFYKMDTLANIARKFNYHLISNGSFHILSKEKKSQKLFNVLNNKWIYNFAYIYVKKRMNSKTSSDFLYLNERIGDQ